MESNIEGRSELCTQCVHYPDRFSVKGRCSTCARSKLLADNFIPQPVFNDNEAQFLLYAEKLGFEYLNFFDNSIMLWYVDKGKMNGIRKDFGEINIRRNITRLIESGQLKPEMKCGKDVENGNKDR